MSSLNNSLFLLINASSQPSSFMLNLAVFFAEYIILLIPILLVVIWLRGSEKSRKLLLLVFVSIVFSLLINQVISWFWQNPRPFVIGLGNNFLKHSPDSSFPSDHLTIIWSVAFCLFLQKDWRNLGIVILIIGLPVAWARIYLGVHYPFDMLGAMFVAFFSATICVKFANIFIPSLYKVVYKLYYLLFLPLIKRGWVNK